MRIAIIALALALAGCSGDRMARWDAEDDAACKGSRNYDQCRALRVQYRQVRATEDAADAGNRTANTMSASRSACLLAGSCW
jgi:hypothetical protein